MNNNYNKYESDSLEEQIEALRQRIYLADEAAQRAKGRRSKRLFIISTIIAFLIMRVAYPQQLLVDILAAPFLGCVVWYILGVILALISSGAVLPEDVYLRELEREYYTLLGKGRQNYYDEL